ncbi:MAG: hypothetical protein ABJM37_08580, partial [Gilvibacter sp.]
MRAIIVKNWCQLSCRLAAILSCLIISPAFSAQTISAADQGFLYTGRVDFSDPNQPLISWPGTSIKANFTGNSLVILMDDENGKNYFNVILNGKDQFPAVISLQKGLHEYDLSY